MSTSASVIPKQPKIELEEEEIDEDVTVEKTKKKLPEDPSKWPLDIETAVLNGIIHHKPVGIHAPFRMYALLDFVYSWTPLKDSVETSANGNFQAQKYQSLLSEYDITSDDLWNYLNAHYDLKALNQTESNHIANFTHATDFELPESDFGALMKMKAEHDLAAPDSPPPAKQRKTKSNSKSGSGKPAAEDAESSSSRSSTPASGGNAAIILPPTTRRSRQRKD